MPLWSQIHLRIRRLLPAPAGGRPAARTAGCAKKMSYKFHNPNPWRNQVGDCTVRAVSKALEQSWEETFVGLCLQGFYMCDMPSANHVWGAYLKEHGFRRHIMPDTCPDFYTVMDFAHDHPGGTYILALPGHVVCVKNGDWYDTWDSGMEVPLYYWSKEC